MKPFTFWMEESDIQQLRELAKRMELPPHVLARSIFVRALRVETSNEKSGQEAGV
jgi:hypothetical protein